MKTKKKNLKNADGALLKCRVVTKDIHPQARIEIFRRRIDKLHAEIDGLRSEVARLRKKP